jgi:hypothetical protein
MAFSGTNTVERNWDFRFLRIKQEKKAHLKGTDLERKSYVYSYRDCHDL